MHDILYRFPHRWKRRDAGENNIRRIREQPGLTQFRQTFGDESHRGRALSREGIPEVHRETRAGENDGPGAADQAGSDDGDFAHEAHSRWLAG